MKSARTRKKKNPDRIYIYNVCNHACDYYTVKVPKVIDGVKDGIWPTRNFSKNKYGKEQSLKLAQQYRDECISKNTSLPSGLMYSNYTQSLDTRWMTKMQIMGQIQKLFGFIKISTLPMIGMFAFNALSAYDFAEHAQTHPDGIRRQLSSLRNRQLIDLDTQQNTSAVGRGNINHFLLTKHGRSLLLRVRKLVSMDDDVSNRLHPLSHYADLYREFKKFDFYIAFNEVILLLFYEQGVTSNACIVDILEKEGSAMSLAVKSAAKKGLIQASCHGVFTGDSDRKIWNRPHYELSDLGTHVLSMVRKI